MNPGEVFKKTHALWEWNIWGMYELLDNVHLNEW